MAKSIKVDLGCIGSLCRLFILQCTTTWHQPGLSRDYVDKLKQMATEKKLKQTETSVYKVAPATKYPHYQCSDFFFSSLMLLYFFILCSDIPPIQKQVQLKL